MEVLLIVIGFIQLLIFLELRKLQSKIKSPANENSLLVAQGLPFPEARAGGISFPLSKEAYEVLKPTTSYPVFPEAQIDYAYRLYSSVGAFFHTSDAKNEEELSRKCYELLRSQNAGKIYEAMIEANIAVLNGETIEDAYRAYDKKLGNTSMKEPAQSELKKLYDEELKSWKKHIETDRR